MGPGAGRWRSLRARAGPWGPGACPVSIAIPAPTFQGWGRREPPQSPDRGLERPANPAGRPADPAGPTRGGLHRQNVSCLLSATCPSLADGARLALVSCGFGDEGEGRHRGFARRSGGGVFQADPAARLVRGAGAEGTARFSLEATEQRPAAPARPASRRDDTASARSDAIRADRMDAAKTENAKIGAARTETAKSDRAKSDKAESGPSGALQESRTQTTAARNKPLAARTGRDGAEAASTRGPGAAKTANSAAQRPERPAADGAEPAQEAAAEEVAAKEAGAAVVSEDETRERDETDPASPEAAAPTPPRPAPRSDASADECGGCVRGRGRARRESARHGPAWRGDGNRSRCEGRHGGCPRLRRRGHGRLRGGPHRSGGADRLTHSGSRRSRNRAHPARRRRRRAGPAGSPGRGRHGGGAPAGDAADPAGRRADDDRAALALGHEPLRDPPRPGRTRPHRRVARPRQGGRQGAGASRGGPSRDPGPAPARCGLPAAGAGAGGLRRRRRGGRGRDRPVPARRDRIPERPGRRIRVPRPLRRRARRAGWAGRPPLPLDAIPLRQLRAVGNLDIRI